MKGQVYVERALIFLSERVCTQITLSRVFKKITTLYVCLRIASGITEKNFPFES